MFKARSDPPPISWSFGANEKKKENTKLPMEIVGKHELNHVIYLALDRMNTVVYYILLPGLHQM